MARLVYIHNIAMPGPEANTVNVAKMCNAFAANGCEVTLAALPGAPKDELAARLRAHYGLNQTFEVTPLPDAAARPTLAALAGGAMARRLGADIAYTRAPHVALATCLAGVPTVLELHTDLGAFSALGRAALRRALHQDLLLGLVVISDALAQHLRREITQARIVVAHDGANSRPPAPARPQSDRFTAGFVGGFYRGKGLELIGALAPLCPWAEFHLIGGDAAKAAPLMQDAAPNIVFHGAMSHAAAQHHVDGWDVALAPYQRTVIVADGRTDAARWMSPLKLFEYMAAGKAILASDLPVLREILSDGKTALLLSPDAPQAWAEALLLLRERPALRERLGVRARALFEERFTWRARARHILEALGITAPTAALEHAV